MDIFKNIIYYTGWCVWIAGAICLIAVLIPLVYQFILKPLAWSTFNLWFYFFGKKSWERKNSYLELWQKKYAHCSGVREYYKSWRHFRRLAYIRILKEARKEIHAKHN